MTTVIAPDDAVEVGVIWPRLLVMMLPLTRQDTYGILCRATFLYKTLVALISKSKLFAAVFTSLKYHAPPHSMKVVPTAAVTL